MVQEMLDSEEFIRYMTAYSYREVTVFVQFTAKWSENSIKMSTYYEDLCDRFFRNTNRFVTLDINACNRVAETCKAFNPTVYCVYRKGKLLEKIENAGGQHLLPLIRRYATN